jgi:manganese transport protein
VLVLRFQWIERIFGLSGLLMIVFAVSAVAMHPDWSQAARGFVPAIRRPDTRHALLYGYFAVGIFSALLMVYEVHFYSSGAMEEDWTARDLGENFMVAAFGSVLGALLTASLLILGAEIFRPRRIFPRELGTAVMAGAYPFGPKARLLALLGTAACLGGAAIETALSGAYNLCQFFDLPWGKNMAVKSVPGYTASWVGMFLLATLIALTGVEPLDLVNISIIFGMVIMPLTYYPILRAAADHRIMGRRVNSKMVTVTGGFFLVLIVAAAAAAIPLMIATHSGEPGG